MKIKSANGDIWDSEKKEFIRAIDVKANKLQSEFIQQLVSVRLEQHLSQKEIEKRCGVKQPVIAKLETSVTNPQLMTIARILASMNKRLVIV